MIRNFIKGILFPGLFFIFACYSNPERAEAPPDVTEKIEPGVSILPEKEFKKSAPPLPESGGLELVQEVPEPLEYAEAEEKEVEEPEVLGLAFTDAVIRVMKDELDSFGGWRPNDLIFGRLWHNRKYEQLGELEVIRQTVRIFKQNIARSGGMDKFDPRMAIAEAEFWNDPGKFWFPSAESKYRNGIKAIFKYRDALLSGEAKFYPRSDNLYLLMDQYIAILGDVHHQLMRRDAKYFEIDNIYFYARGAAYAMAEILSAVQVDFSEEIKSRGLSKLMRESIEPLKEGSGLAPLIILNGSSDDLRANHRLNLAAYISEARTKLYAMIETLQK
jgi:hypothetical protein